jgi:hypothetical protein
MPFVVTETKAKVGWAGHVARVGKISGVYRVLMGNPEGKRPLGRPRHRCEDKTVLSEIRCALTKGAGSDVHER